MTSERPLGRREPQDFEHVDKYPLLTAKPVTKVNKILKLPYWHWQHDQGSEGSCAGHGSGMERAISNTSQNVVARVFSATRWYDPIDIWNQAKLIDSFPDTNPGDDNGTTVRATYDVLRNIGPRRVKKMVLSENGVPTPVKEFPRDPGEGVSVTRWATTVDEMRFALSQGTPISIGINWYENFDNPANQSAYYWIGYGNLGKARGGHCVCVYGASDKRQAFRVKNSWGRSYPLVWLPYKVMERLLDENGEAALTTDR